jgi:mannan endo-1,4-beta-mannosidase
MKQLIFFLVLCITSILISERTAGQSSLLYPPLDNDFVYRSGSKLLLNDRQYYSIGVNCYYLQNLAAYGDTFHIDEVFREAKSFGVNTIRTWGFFDYSDSNHPAVIQYLPGRYKEKGLQALDYVIMKAREYSICLIIPFVNSWDDYGGMNQYVRWRGEIEKINTKEPSSLKQRRILGVENRSYLFYVTNTLTHDDFYNDVTIKQWYKDYVSMLLNRVNTFTDIQYKDDPIILAWELANEPRSSDPSGMIVTDWLNEMSTFVKLFDPDHLISTGEEGLDISQTGYSSPAKYNEQGWLFDGTAGISFRNNLVLPNIDIGSIHCYPEAWKLSANQGIRWLNEHQHYADEIQKPLLVGEIGKWQKRNFFFEGVYNNSLYSTTAGVLVWQFAYDGRSNNDGYAFYFPKDSNLCAIISKYAQSYIEKIDGTLPIPSDVMLLPNYPNPFNQVTLIPYHISEKTHIRLNVYNTTGQQVVNLVDEFQEPGYHIVPLDGFYMTSGAYFIHLVTKYTCQTIPIMLVR